MPTDDFRLAAIEAQVGNLRETVSGLAATVLAHEKGDVERQTITLKALDAVQDTQGEILASVNQMRQDAADREAARTAAREAAEAAAAAAEAAEAAAAAEMAIVERKVTGDLETEREKTKQAAEAEKTKRVEHYTKVALGVVSALGAFAAIAWGVAQSQPSEASSHHAPAQISAPPATSTNGGAAPALPPF